MKPCFHDRNLIWTEQLENGEIGIFYFDGNVYVKKLQNNMRVVVMGEETVVCRLKERRTSLGFTQHQVSERTKMNVRTVINIEKGKTIPNLLYSMKLAKFLWLKVEEVFEYFDQIQQLLKIKSDESSIFHRLEHRFMLFKSYSFFSHYLYIYFFLFNKRPSMIYFYHRRPTT